MRAIPDDNLAIPVLIKLQNGATGSGCYVTDGPHLHLVTAYHVLYDRNSASLLHTAAELLRSCKKITNAK